MNEAESVGRIKNMKQQEGIFSNVSTKMIFIRLRKKKERKKSEWLLFTETFKRVYSYDCKLFPCEERKAKNLWMVFSN